MKPETTQKTSQKRACILCPFVGINKIFTHNEMRKISSSVASDRLQTQPLIRALIRLNYEISLVSLNKNFQLSDLSSLKKYEICIITKMRPDASEDNEDQFAQFHTYCTLWLKRTGSKIFTIYSDHIANYNSPGGDLYKNILYLSDHVITPSQELQILAQRTCENSKVYSVIEDPCLLNRTPFKRIEKNTPVRIIWFGNPPNLKYLMLILQDLMAKSNPSDSYELKILTSEQGINEFSKFLKLIGKPIHWKIKFIVWDPKNQPYQLEKELSDANISLLPSDPTDLRKSGVSHNRLVDSIQSGCITIASPVKSYKELSKVCLIGNNFSRLLEYSINHNHRLCDKYTDLRPEALMRFDAKLNIQKWENAIQKTLLN